MNDKYAQFQESRNYHTQSLFYTIDDIDFNEAVEITGRKKLSWKAIERRLLSMVKLPNLVFEHNLQ